MSSSGSNAKPQDLDTALVTCRDLGQLAKAAAINGGTVPNGVKVISALLLQHVTSPELALVAVNALNLVVLAAPHAPAMFRLEGGVKAAVAILVNHSDKAKALGPTVKVLARACMNSSMTSVAFLKERGGLEHMLRSLNMHLGDHGVVAPVCDLLSALSRHEKSARLLPASEVVTALRDVLVGYLGRWDVCSTALRVLKNLSKCDEARLVLLRSTECTKLLLGVSRILARLPERRKLFKRAYRTLWLLFCGLVPQLPGADMLADEELGLVEQQPASDDEMHNAVFPESQVESAERHHGPAMDCPAAKVRGTVVPWWELPGEAACLAAAANDPALAAYHADGEPLVARAMLHELERIMHPSRALNTVVYDDLEGPLVPADEAAGSIGGAADPAAAAVATAAALVAAGVHTGPARKGKRPGLGGNAAPSMQGVVLNQHGSGGVGGSSGSGSSRAAPSAVAAAAGPSSAALSAAAAAASELESVESSRMSTSAQSGSTTATINEATTKANDKASTPPLVFESRFETGNLQRAVRVYDREYDLHLAPDLTDPESRCQWFYFSVRGAVPGLAYKFNVVNLGKKDSLYNSGMRPLVCVMDKLEQSRTAAEKASTGGDGSSASPYLKAPPCMSSKGWVRGGEDVCYYPTPYRSVPPSKTASKGATPKKRKTKKGKSEDEVGKGMCGHGLYGATFTLQMDSIAPHYLAMCYPYTYTELQAYLRSALQTRMGSREICRRSLLCNTLKGNRVDCVTITDFASLGEGDADGVLLNRPYVVVSARVHPGETNASWMMKGVMDFLLSNSPTAVRLRATYVFKCVPMLNPDGVINGNYRCSLSGCDLNRTWANPSKKRHPPIYFVKRMIDRVARSGRLVLFCDLHGHSRKEDVFIYGCEPGRARDGGEAAAREEAEARARVRMLPFLIGRLNPAFVMRKCSFKVSKGKFGAGRVVVCRELGVPNSYTIEASFSGASHTGRHMTAKEYAEMGQSFLLALAEATEAIETSVEAEQELLHQVDEACGLGLSATVGGAEGGEEEEDEGSDGEEQEEE